jgi:hypothetical protein
VGSETATIRAEGLQELEQLQAIKVSLTELVDNIGSLVAVTAQLVMDFSRASDTHSPSQYSIATPSQSNAGDVVPPGENRNTFTDTKDQRLQELFPF